jgi:exodeoxyribonuclease V beta subunit
VSEAAQPFDLYGPLPSGVTVLEASAGTGKTFTIAALAVRYVAEGVALDRLLLVTFTRLATSELRERVRDRLIRAVEGLGDAMAGSPPPDDELVALLASGPEAEVRERHDRLVTALAGFDGATIETTHGFCLHMLSGLGVAANLEPGVTLVEDARDLLTEAVDDLYVRKFHAASGVPLLTRRAALKIATEVVAHPDAELVEPPEGNDEAAMRHSLANAIRREIDDRKRRARIMTYDDVLIRLRDALTHPQQGRAAVARLRERYDVALVDEFQDTDPVQWDIVGGAFSAARALVLIGDPKQAIYAFRGADVYAYLAAAAAAAQRSTLDTNWRSDRELLGAFDALFDGVQLGDAGIEYRKVQAAPGRTAGSAGPALRFRIVPRRSDVVELTAKGYASAPSARRVIAADLADDVVRVLERGTVRCGDTAVLVRTNDQAAAVRTALDAAGVPAVTAGAGSVFATPAAADWLRLLEALEQPAFRDRAASLALTPILGWKAAMVGTAPEEEWDLVHGRLHEWSALLRRRGVAALLEHVWVSESLPARILSRPAGERYLTDVRHIGDLLHTAATTEGLGATAVRAWLSRRIAESARDAGDEERSRRLESDADAVQVLTIHRSKGLEFPVVYCPYLWDGWGGEEDVPVFHPPGGGASRSIDVSGSGTQWTRHRQWQLLELRGEELRLVYVALTRARHQVVMWWAGGYSSSTSPLGRLLFARKPDGTVALTTRKVPDDDAVLRQLTTMAEQAEGSIGVEHVEAPIGLRWGHAPEPAVELMARSFDRSLDLTWRRTSYTGIVAQAHTPRVGSEAADPVLADDDDDATRAASAEPAGDGHEHLRDVAVLLGPMPGGTRVGTAIHRILETTDFAGDSLEADLDIAIGRAGVDLGDPAVVRAGLVAALSMTLPGGLALRHIEQRDRLDELSFELALAGGDEPTGALSVPDLAGALRRHGQLGGYPDLLSDPAIDRQLRGFLTGSLDLVLRLPGPRFVVVDYKTNRLGPAGEALTAWHYRPAALQAEMERAHYPLQALLYLVALHRYLRWRLPGYQPDVHLGGAQYLFLRGMSAPDHPAGVWSWTPPGALVGEVSDLLDRGRP